jgi:coenzyme PQQ biosynthesis protein C
VTELLSSDELKARLIAVGQQRYHDKHPFHARLHEGRCTRGEVQAWALNRFYYQAHIPTKDATLIARMDDPALRRAWRQRLVDHDGNEDGDGGIARWLKLAEGVGLDLDEVAAHTGVLAGTRFAVDAYVAFVRTRPLLEAVASSLTELFSPAIIQNRVEGMLKHYDFVSPETLSYFTARPAQARRDVDVALGYVLANARTPDQQQAAISALVFKCDVLWSMLDALHFSYVAPGIVPPGAFVPEAV